MIETLPQQLVNGLIMGGMYGLMALGLTLVFGLLHILNIAHGEVITLGGMAGYWVAQMLGLNWLLGLLFAIFAGGVFGLMAERLLFRRVVGDAFSGLIVAFGLSLVLQGFFFYFWGGLPRFTTPLLRGTFDWGVVSLSHQRVLVFGVTMLSYAILYYVLKRTRMGKGVRAFAQNRTAAALMGVSARWIYPWAVTTGSALGGLAGALMASLMTIGPFFGAEVIMKGFVVVVLGGMGYVPGAVVGGLLLGVMESLGASYLSSAFKDGYGFILMILVLLVRPKGLFGAREIL